LGRRIAVLAIAVVVIAARLCHSSVLWADDNLPLAAAMQVALGKTLYRDVWFDKPPMVAWVDLLWGARDGVALRLAGAIYVLAAAGMAWKFARSKWGEYEGILAFGFVAFFLTFELPSAILPLASDMLLILPHLAAIYFAWRGRAFWSGAAAGVGLLCSSKALFVLAACALWQWRSLPMLAVGFAIPNAIAIGWMGWHGSAREFYRQVWQWGSIYAASTFVENPWAEGVRRTADWVGFHAALAVGAILFIWRERKWKIAAWMAIAFAGVVLGLRFFPRYYFLLLPPMTIAAARGWASARRWHAAALIVLLAIPAIRFGPRYVTLARGETWRDLDIDRASRVASAKLRELVRPGDTLFVWGFRPDIFIDSKLPAGTRFLESQAISGVLADRHLFDNRPVEADFIGANRMELMTTRPTWIVDGLGPYNPALAIDRQAYLESWMARYQVVARAGFSVLYHLR
jgi:hypothetical protein